jgi:dipeptidyl aminopeptidase/acylaminoacyl peptidase
MRNALRTLGVVAAALCLTALSSRARAADADWTPERAFRVKRVSAVQVSPDGRLAAYVVAEALMVGEKSEWLSHIQVAHTDGSGAFQLTRGEHSATGPAWSPDGRFLAFVSSRNGKSNVWRIPVSGGEAEVLTDEKGGVQAPRWSPDGKQIAFLATDAKTEDEEKADKEKRDARVVDEKPKMIRLCVVPVDKGPGGKREVRRLTGSDLSVGSVAGGGEFDWSPDSATIAFEHQPTPSPDDWTKGDVSTVAVDSGTVRPLATSRAAESDPQFSPDGRSVALVVTNDPPTWTFRARVAIVPASGGTPRLLAVTPDEQPNLVGWTADGKRLLVAEARGTLNRLSALPADGGALEVLSPAGTMVDGPSLNESGTHVGYTSQAFDRPVEAFAAAVAPFTPVQLAKVQEPLDAPFARTEVVTWKAPDGQQIEGVLTYPSGYVAGSRVPLLLMVHGGPTGVFLQSFIGVPSPYPVAILAARGYAILRCNVRGSSGYGFAFRSANVRDWGGGDYRDLMSGVDSLVAKGIADPERLGVMGWSYGGFMTSWIITQTKRFKAASVGAGVTNLMSFTGTSDIPGFVPDYFGGEHWDVFERWRTHSAMFHVKAVSTPTLIQHGESDLRVPVSQGYELYNALKRQGVTTRMVVYPRQPHGIQEPKLLLDALNRNVDWFERFIPTRSTRPAPAAQ